MLKGKTTLVSWILNRARLGDYLTIISPIDVRTLNEDLNEVKETLQTFSNILYVFDEESTLLNSSLCDKRTAANLLKNSNNLFLIITRDKLALPEIYTSLIDIIECT